MSELSESIENLETTASACEAVCEVAGEGSIYDPIDGTTVYLSDLKTVLAAAKMLSELHGELGSVLNAQEWPTTPKDQKDIRVSAGEVYRRAQELLK